MRTSFCSIAFALVGLLGCGVDARAPDDAVRCPDGLEVCAGTVPARSPRNLARTGKRTRGSNTQLGLPQNLLLADVDGDERSDLLQFDRNRIAVSSTSYEQTGILQLFLQRPVQRVLTGDFHGDGYDQTCAITDDGLLACFGISTGRDALWWWFTQGNFIGANEDAVVADFDGDGRDDVLVYPRGGGAYRLYSLKGDHFFAASTTFHAGNLGVATAGLSLRAGDFNGDGRDDLMLVNGWRQVLSYTSVNDGTHDTFWWGFTSHAYVVGSDDQVTVARIDDDASDDVVLRNRVTGATRFYRLASEGGYLPGIGVPAGQLDQSPSSLIAWGHLRGDVDEPGAATRDDALVFQLGTNLLVRSDARWDGSQLTYWWAYTQYAPGHGPVDGSPRVGGASPLVKAHTEHLGRMTGSAPNPLRPLGMVGTDLGVSYETPRGLAFLFGDSWTVVPGVRQDEDSFAYTQATGVGRFAMPTLAWAAEAFTGAFRAFVVAGVSLRGMEVPVEGLAVGDTQYVFFSSGWNDGAKRYSRSVLAHGGGFDPAAMVRDHDVASDRFINISSVVEGPMVYLFGSGHYRQSGVYLARVELWNLADRAQWQYFRGTRRGQPVFGPLEPTAVELVADRCVGELSVRKHPARPLYLMAYNCGEPRGIVLRTATTPTGPWTDQVVLFDPWADGGYQHFMHASESFMGHDDGLAEPYGSSARRDEWGGEYGPYFVPRWFRTDEDGAERVVFVMSSWNPYQVHLMESVLVAPGVAWTPPVRGAGLPRASLANGSFAAGNVSGWWTSGDGGSFRVFTGSDGQPRLTTYTIAKGDAAVGSIYQDLTVDAATSELRFRLHGGDGTIELWHNGQQVRRSQGRNSNAMETQVVWQLHEYRGETVRLVVSDSSTAAWGFVGVSGFELR